MSKALSVFFGRASSNTGVGQGSTGGGTTR